MKSQSADFATKALTTSALYHSKFIVNATAYTDTVDDFRLVNYENPDSDISIGNTCASSISFSITNPSVELENKEVTFYEGLQVGNSIEYAKLGIFKIGTSTSDGEKSSYTGYDKMYYLFEKPYFSDLSFPSTDKAIIEELCTQAGITLKTTITTAHTVSTKPEGYTRREVLGYMAALQGKNAVINADGNLELRWYTAVDDYTIDGSHIYDGGATFDTSTNFVIQKLTCYVGSGTDTETLTAGSGATGITFTNPFMTQAILNEVYNKIKNFTYRPMTVNFVGDIRLEVGDIVSVTKDSVTYSVPIMQITNECDGGLSSTIKSIGKSSTDNSTAQSGPITKAMERYYAELVTINKALINKLDVGTANITYATIDNLNATNATVEELEANAVTADYADLHYAKIDLTNIANGTIKQAMIDDGAIGTAQIADASITDGKIVGLTASKLTAGTIDASDIDVINLNCANLTVGSINGTQIANGAIDSDKLESTLNDTIIGTKDEIDNLTIGGENALIASKTLINDNYYIADTLTVGSEALTVDSDRLIVKEVA